MCARRGVQHFVEGGSGAPLDSERRRAFQVGRAGSRLLSSKDAEDSGLK